MQPPADPRASDIEGEMLTDISAGLLRDVRAQCAPTASGEPACSRVAQVDADGASSAHDVVQTGRAVKARYFRLAQAESCEADNTHSL